MTSHCGLYEVWTVFKRAKLQQITTFLEKFISFLRPSCCSNVWGLNWQSLGLISTTISTYCINIETSLDLKVWQIKNFRLNGGHLFVLPGWTLFKINKYDSQTITESIPCLSCRHPEPFSLSYGVKPLPPHVTFWSKYESRLGENYYPHFNALSWMPNSFGMDQSRCVHVGLSFSCTSSFRCDSDTKYTNIKYQSCCLTSWISWIWIQRS